MSKAQDDAFAELALAQGVEPACLESASGSGGPLAQALVRSRAIPAADAARLLNTLAQSEFTCANCAERVDYSALGSLDSLACPHCNGALRSLVARRLARLLLERGATQEAVNLARDASAPCALDHDPRTTGELADARVLEARALHALGNAAGAAAALKAAAALSPRDRRELNAVAAKLR